MSLIPRRYIWEINLQKEIGFHLAIHLFNEYYNYYISPRNIHGVMDRTIDK